MPDEQLCVLHSFYASKAFQLNWEKIEMKKTIGLSQELAAFIQQSKNGKRLMPSGKHISKGVITNYEYAARQLLDYEQFSNCSYEITLLPKPTLAARKREKKYWNQFYLGFSGFLYKRKQCHDN